MPRLVWLPSFEHRVAVAMVKASGCYIQGHRFDTIRCIPSNPIRSLVAEIGKSVAAVCQYVENEHQKKASKERKKAEKKEAEEREKVERAAAELTKKKEEGKARKEADRIEEMNKNLDIKVAVRVGELWEDVREDLRQEIREAIGKLFVAVTRGKQKKIQPAVSASDNSGSSSETEEPSTRTRNLCITEKRKRGEEPVFEDSPPTELPPKRTPRKTGKPVNLTFKLTRSRAKEKMKTVTPTPKKTPASIHKKKIPTSIGMVARLKLEKQFMHELKNLDALVLQNVCSDEGIPYNGKFEAVFDIAAHHIKLAYDTDDEDEAETSQEAETKETTEGDGKPEVE
ncbi:hypothetical protein CBR_g51325 [Chara braunii]|uniref:Uncharacterized protein n=1 Tax=Chara braunii TaxID=69332 RepID=A0A388M8E1_CHABU|nr:hypothetical protein CBR_g51325 [Chara braunii]|eukprot:GBG90820.1 hypothetical protein CBR_g51325 [Chara braunii]